MAARTLIVVAQRDKARFFHQATAGAKLEEVCDLVHPESRAHGRNLDTDRPGRVHDRYGPGRHAMGQVETSKERAASDFAREVARELGARRNADDFVRLMLVAEPGFLGLLRSSLDPATAKTVHVELAKGLATLRVDEIYEHVRDLLRR